METENSSVTNGGKPDTLPVSAADNAEKSGMEDETILTAESLKREYIKREAEALAADTKGADTPGGEKPAASETPEAEAGTKPNVDAEASKTEIENLEKQLEGTLDEKTKASIQKVIDKKHAQMKAAQEERDGLKNDMEKMREQIAKLEKGETDQTTSGPSDIGTEIARSETLDEVSKLQERADKAKRFARQHLNSDDELPFKVDPKTGEDSEERYTREELNDILQTAEDALDKWIPNQKQYIEVTGQYNEFAKKDFPFLYDKEHKAFKWAQESREGDRYSFLKKSMPDFEYLLGLLWEGKVVTEARLKSAEDATGADGENKELGTVKSKPAEKGNEIAAKPTGPASGAAPASSEVLDDAQKRQQAMDAGDGNMSQTDLTAFYKSY